MPAKRVINRIVKVTQGRPGSKVYDYKVTATKNTTNPKIGDILSEAGVQTLIDEGVNVEITSLKR